MTHRGPFQPQTFCDSVTSTQLLGFILFVFPPRQFTQLLCSSTPVVPLSPGHLLSYQAPSSTLWTQISRTRPWATLLVPCLHSEKWELVIILIICLCLGV